MDGNFAERFWEWLLVSVFALPSPATETTVPQTPVSPCVTNSIAVQEQVERPEPLPRDLPSGSLIFSQGDCLAVKIFTQSAYTHVGVVVNREGQIVVYDSMNGIGVRKLPETDFLRTQVPGALQVARLRQPLTPAQEAELVVHLESQLGRPYRVLHHTTGQRCDGVHCAEYATDALMAARLIRAQQPPRVSPGSLLQGVTEARIHELGEVQQLKPAPIILPAEETWCQRQWRQTGECCSASCRQMSRWFLCREW